jgi:MoxR-like ATPase
MAFPILRHRLILSYEAIADGKTTDQIISNILDLVTIK